MSRGQKSFDVHARESLFCREQLLREIQVRARKEKRRAVEKALIF